jgi:hypothetical protein
VLLDGGHERGDESVFREAAGEFSGEIGVQVKSNLIQVRLNLN